MAQGYWNVPRSPAQIPVSPDSRSCARGQRARGLGLLWLHGCQELTRPLGTPPHSVTTRMRGNAAPSCLPQSLSSLLMLLIKS